MFSFDVCQCGAPLQRNERPTPKPQGGEVLVRITAAGVCHSDVHLWEGYFDMGGGNKYSTAKTMNPPRIMGHEIVGVVEALGPDAKGAKVGDKAVVYPWIGCGKCWYCDHGTENLCPTPRALGVNNDGGYADHVLVPHAKYLYPYGNLPEELACLYACSGITAFGAVKKAVGHDGGQDVLLGEVLRADDVGLLAGGRCERGVGDGGADRVGVGVLVSDHVDRRGGRGRGLGTGGRGGGCRHANRGEWRLPAAGGSGKSPRGVTSWRRAVN